MARVRTCGVALLLLVAFGPYSQAKDIFYKIPEEKPQDERVGTVVDDSGLSAKYDAAVQRVLRYQLWNRNDVPGRFFAIDNRTSILKTRQPIDRDTLCNTGLCCNNFERCILDLTVSVGPAQYWQTIKVHVEIEDKNDNRPEFETNPVTLKIPETSPVGSEFHLQTATDPDAGNNSVISYSIVDPDKIFELRVAESFGNTELYVVVNRTLDRELSASHQVRVIAKDHGVPPQTGSLLVMIEIQDANDNAPEFLQRPYEVRVKENVTIGTSIVKVEAVDDDAGENGKITFSIRARPSEKVSKLFRIDADSGEIFTKGELDYEDTSVYNIPIMARDKGANSFPVNNWVNVYIDDVNDHQPEITINFLTDAGRAEVSESASLETFVAHILVKDPDKGKNAEVSCTIDNKKFRLQPMGQDEPNQYKLVTAAKLNRENQSEHEIMIMCSDAGDPPLRSGKLLSIFVTDANDNKPTFPKKTYSTTVFENNTIGAFLLQVSASDSDSGNNGKISYSINNGKKYARIDPDGKIYANRSFDRERYDQIRLQVVATDGGKPAQSATATVIIHISDMNDNPPRFTKKFSFDVAESIRPYTNIGNVSAEDSDVGSNAEVTFKLLNNYASEVFDVNSKGVITTKKDLDREHRAFYDLVVLARDNGKDERLSSTATIRINVTDVNDSPPKIHFPSHHNNTVYISFLEPVDHVITQVNATDADSGINSMLTYVIKSGNSDGIFRIDPDSGEIKVAKSMEEKDALLYKLVIKVIDRGIPQNLNMETLNIVIDGTGKAIDLTGVYIDGVPSNRNLIIVVCLAAVSGVLAIVLIIAIVCIKRKDRDNHRYNVKTETQKIFHHRGEKRNSHGSITSDDEKPPKKEVSFSIETEEMAENSNNQSTFLTMKTQPSWNSSINPKMLEHPRACSSLIHGGNTPENQHKVMNDLSSQTGQSTFGKGRTMQHHPVQSPEAPQGEQNKQLMELLKQCDTDSELSQASNADSGRGGSDEDITTKTQDISVILPPTPVTEIPARGSYRSPQGYPEHRNIVRNPQDYSMNNSQDSVVDNRVADNNFSPRNNCSFSSFKISNTPVNANHVKRAENDYKYNTPKHGDYTPEKDSRYRTPKTSFRSATPGSPGVDYSCADMNSVLNASQNNGSPPQDYGNSSASTTNSGSSNVDPEELCNEIDNLFFRDMVV